MGLPQTISYVWPSTNASIPANWTRTTALDTYHLHVATGDTAGTTGGSATHTHAVTNTAHNFSGGAGSGGQKYTSPGGLGQSVTVTHAHSATTSNVSDFTSGTASNNPPWISCIFIKPSDGNRTGLPNGAWGLFDTALIASWSIPAASKNVFVKGAAAGGDSDLVGGGSDTHDHDISHSHSAKGSLANATADVNFGAGSTYARTNHNHQVSLNNKVLTSDGDDLWPAWEKWLWGQNDTGTDFIVNGIIGFYLGLIADIPAGYSQVSITAGYDFIKGADNAGEVGDVDGVRQHDHGGAQTAHNHTATAGTASSTIGAAATGSSSTSIATHTHVWTISSVQDVMANSSSKAHYPPYKEVILLKYDGPTTPTGMVITRTLLGVGL